MDDKESKACAGKKRDWSGGKVCCQWSGRCSEGSHLGLERQALHKSKLLVLYLCGGNQKEVINCGRQGEGTLTRRQSESVIG